MEGPPRRAFHPNAAPTPAREAVLKLRGRAEVAEGVVESVDRRERGHVERLVGLGAVVGEADHRPVETVVPVEGDGDSVPCTAVQLLQHRWLLPFGSRYSGR